MHRLKCVFKLRQNKINNERHFSKETWLVENAKRLCAAVDMGIINNNTFAKIERKIHKKKKK